MSLIECVSNLLLGRFLAKTTLPKTTLPKTTLPNIPLQCHHEINLHTLHERNLKMNINEGSTMNKVIHRLLQATCQLIMKVSILVTCSNIIS